MSRPQPLKKQPQQARSRELVSAIVEAAARVFDERGYDATTTNHVADVAGVSVGSVYQYFTDKRSLLTALHERHAEHVLQVIDDARRQAPGRGLQASVETVIGGLLSIHRAQPNLQSILHDEHASAQYRKTDSAIGRAILQSTIQLLEAFPRSRGENSALSAQLLIRTIEELVHAAVLDPPADASNEEVEEAIVQTAVALLLREAGAKQESRE